MIVLGEEKIQLFKRFVVSTTFEQRLTEANARGARLSAAQFHSALKIENARFKIIREFQHAEQMRPARSSWIQLGCAAVTLPRLGQKFCRVQGLAELSPGFR